MAGKSVAARGKQEEVSSRCATCVGTGWQEYLSELPSGTLEPAWMLCDCSSAQAYQAELEVEASEATKAAKKNTALVERILRGIELYQDKGSEVEDLGEERLGGAYRVPSCSHPGHSYRVWVEKNGERCQCVDYKRNGLGACKHTVCVLIARTKETTYHVEERHNSLFGGYEYAIVERAPLGDFRRDIGFRSSYEDALADVASLELEGVA